MDLFSTFSKIATESGFPLHSGVDLESARPLLFEHVQRYDRWLANGFAGEMEYLRRGRDRRADPTLVLPGAKSILSIAIPYRRILLGETDSIRGPRFARYLEGRDYHDTIAERLNKVLEQTRAKFGSLQWKVCVDTSAVLERAWATMTGLGWIGRNTHLIHPKEGSYLFLAEIFLNYALNREPVQMQSYCGNCSRCIDACPMGALKDGVLDSNRCISYLTLEKRAPLAASSDESPLRTQMGTWVAGCDICQEVCPFNRKPVRATENSGAESSPASTGWRWDELLKESAQEYRERSRTGALSRVKPSQFSRNLAVALANAIQASGSEFRREIAPLVEARIKVETGDVLFEWERCWKLLREA